MMKNPEKKNKPCYGLKYSLIRKGITQRKLAEMININTATLSQIINGRITLSLPVAESIADALDISLYDFY